MKMSDNDIYTLLGAALESTDYERYLAEWGTSIIFFPDPEADGPDPDKIVEILKNIWDAAHLSIQEIRAHTGLSQAAFGQHYLIPKRTIENWESGVNTPPNYVRLLLAESVGLWTRP